MFYFIAQCMLGNALLPRQTAYPVRKLQADMITIFFVQFCKLFTVSAENQILRLDSNALLPYKTFGFGKCA